MKRNQCFGRLIVAWLLGCSLSVVGQSTLSLNVGAASQNISKALYGVLMENYGRCIYGGVYVGTKSTIPNINGMRKDVVEGFKEAGVGCIEFPGGCFADKYHWADGTGPVANRPGGEMTNGLGTDEFFQLCSLTNALPYPTANIQSASSAEMNAWLVYIHDRPNFLTTLKWWKIGNEEWDPCGNMTQAAYQTKWDQFYTAEPAWAKTSMAHVMDGGSGGAWVNADCSFLAGKADPTGVSFHYYAVTDWNNKGPSSNFNTTQYYAQLQKAWSINGSITNLETSMGNADPTNKVGLCFDEWGAWYADVAGMGTSFNWSTMRDAVITGMSLNVFNNHCKRVKMALVAQPVNVIQALMLTEVGGQGRMRKTPAFWVFKMFKVHQEAKMVPATMVCANNQNVPLLSASASVDANGSLNISIVNTHDATDQNLTITLNGATQNYTKVTGQIVNGASTTSGITSFTATDTATLSEFTGATLSGTTITAKIPAHSVVMLTLPSPTGSSVAPAMSPAVHASTITAAVDGQIQVHYSVAHTTPVRLSLYGVDGRTLVEKYTGNLVAGGACLAWQPKNRTTAGTYVVKMEAGEFSKTQRVVFSR